MLRAVPSEPKLVYWTAALANMIAIVAIAAFGVARARRRDIAGHRRLMLTATALVAVYKAFGGGVPLTAAK